MADPCVRAAAPRATRPQSIEWTRGPERTRLPELLPLPRLLRLQRVVGRRGLLPGRQPPRHAVLLRTERLYVPIHRPQVALAHLRRVPPGHRRLAFPAVG